MTLVLCTIFNAWGQLLSAAEGAAEGSTPNGLDLTKEPFRYDLVNLGRELLAQLATPLSMNFSDAIKPGNAKPDAAAIRSTGYVFHGSGSLCYISYTNWLIDCSRYVF